MKIIRVKNKKGYYPSNYVLLRHAENRFWLGGSNTRTPVVMVKDSQEAKKVVYRASKDFGFELSYMTIAVKKIGDEGA